MSFLQQSPESPAKATSTSQQFVCDVRSCGHAAVWIRTCGELDLATVPRFEQALHEGLDQALLVVIDLRELSFIDSTGLQAIIEADARARGSARRLAFIRGPAQIDRLFELVGLSRRLEVLDPDAALGQALNASAPSKDRR